MQPLNRSPDALATSDSPDERPAIRTDDVVGLLILSVVGLGAAAVAIDATNAWVGILVGIAGVFLGVLLAITLGETLLAQFRRRHWLRISAQMTIAVRGHVVGLARDFEQVLEDHQILVTRGLQPLEAIGDPSRHNGGETLRSLHILQDRVTAAIHELSSVAEFEVSSSKTLLEAGTFHLEPLRETITALVIGITDDPDLVGPLFELEECRQAWRLGVRDILAFGMGDPYGWDLAIKTLGAAIAVLDSFEASSQAS
jgi:hypothetical protein